MRRLAVQHPPNKLAILARSETSNAKEGLETAMKQDKGQKQKENKKRNEEEANFHTNSVFSMSKIKYNSYSTANSQDII